MKVGIFLDDIAGASYLSRPVDVLVERAVEAEAVGFASAWVPHVPMSVDALVALALIGRETERIEIGSSVIPIQTRHPVAMAQESATVQAIADGRLTLGLGVSHQVIIEQMLGLPYERPATQMREYLEVLRDLFTTGASSHAGELYRLSVGLNMPGVPPSPGGNVPVLIAALGPVMLRLAASLADGTILWMANERAVENHVVPQLRTAAADAGRPEPRVVLGVGVCVCDDPSAARAASAEAFGHYADIPSYSRMLATGDAAPGDVTIAGDSAVVAQRLRSYRDAGVSDFVAFPFGAGDDPEKSLRATWETLASLAPTI